MAANPFVKKLFKGKDSRGEELAEAKAIKSGKISPQQYAAGEKREDKMKGKGFAAGGMIRGTGAATKGNKWKGEC